MTLTLYDECYDTMDSFEISLFDEVDAFYTFGHDATLDDAYKDELSIVPYVKHEIVAAPTLQCDGLHLSYHPKNRVENNTRVLIGHEQHDLCDYILDVVHDATENYYERGKYGYRNFISVSIIHSGITTISIEGINFIKKGYFKRIHRIITLIYGKIQRVTLIRR